MPESGTNSPNLPLVTEAESGQKLLRFLELRLSLPQNLLHRWLRTGQIRLNGRRCKPFDLVAAGDLIRVPPFACKLASKTAQDFACEGPLPELIGKHGQIWAFHKPAGLAVQPGTGQSSSLAGLLKANFADQQFCPAPAHRLDRDTSGVLLVGATHAALRDLAHMFSHGLIRKEYLAWVGGVPDWKEPKLLRHYLSGRDRITASAEQLPGSSEGLCIARQLKASDNCALLQILLLTGRKRQIRSQLAACGYPIIGDSRYSKSGPGLKLHAMRAILPDGFEFSCLPDWQGEYKINELPDKLCPPKTTEKP